MTSARRSRLELDLLRRMSSGIQVGGDANEGDCGFVRGAARGGRVCVGERGGVRADPERGRAQTQLHAYGTNIEGEWDAVFAAIKRCHETVHAMGAPRISTVIKLGTRVDRDQTMDDKVRSVQTKLG